MKNDEKYSKIVGFVLSVISIIGLLFGICIYNKNENDRTGFMKGWLTGSLLIIVFVVLVYLISYIINLNKL